MIVTSGTIREELWIVWNTLLLLRIFLKVEACVKQKVHRIPLYHLLNLGGGPKNTPNSSLHRLKKIKIKTSDRKHVHNEPVALDE